MNATANRVAQRRESLRRAFTGLDVQAMLVTNPVHVSYLTGFSGEDSYLLVTADRELLLSDSRFSEQIEEECPGLETRIRVSGQQMIATVADTVQKLQLDRVGFEAGSMTVAGFDQLAEATAVVQWRKAPGVIEELRAIKDEDEVAQIREAIRIAEDAFGDFLAGVTPDSDEKSLADAMEMSVRRRGGTKSAFPTIVAVGARAALPHAVPTERQVCEDDFLLVDWGAKGKFYHSDLTRILVASKISPKLARIYDIVLEAQLRAIAAIRPGASCADVDAAAREYIEQAGFGENFGHGLGHGLGLEVHEAPSLRRGEKAKLQPGMVVTVEPGIYLRGWGGVRIEDDVLVTKDGCEVLTSVPKRLGELTLA